MFSKISDSVNLPPRKMKFTLGVNLPQAKNHWSMGCIPVRVLNTCLTLSQPQIRNTVEYHLQVP